MTEKENKQYYGKYHKFYGDLFDVVESQMLEEKNFQALNKKLNIETVMIGQTVTKSTKSVKISNRLTVFLNQLYITGVQLTSKNGNTVSMPMPRQSKKLFCLCNENNKVAWIL